MFTPPNSNWCAVVRWLRDSGKFSVCLVGELTDVSTIDPQTIFVIPGVSSFDSVMHYFDRTKERLILEHAYSERCRIVGICAGMQVFFKESAESERAGFGWLGGRSKKFEWSRGFPVPRMEWSKCSLVSAKKDMSLDVGPFYFCHSFYLDSGNFQRLNFDWILLCDYGSHKLIAGLKVGNLVAFQFHPEKSAESGKELISWAFT